MSIAYESDIEQIYLSRYDPIFHLYRNKFHKFDSIKESSQKLKTKNCEEKKLDKDENRDENASSSRIFLTSWKNHRNKSVNEIESHEGNSKINSFSINPVINEFLKDTDQSHDLKKWVGKCEGEEMIQESAIDSQNNSLQRSTKVKEVINVWPPKGKSRGREEILSHSKTNSDLGQVKNILKTVYNESTMAEDLTVAKSTSDIKDLGGPSQHTFIKGAEEIQKDMLNSQIIESPVPIVNNPVTIEHSQVPSIPSELPKDPRRFIKNLGPSSPAGLLAIVTRELSPNIDPSKLLKTPKERKEFSKYIKDDEIDTTFLRKYKLIKSQMNKNSNHCFSSSAEDEEKEEIINGNNGNHCEEINPKNSFLNKPKNNEKHSPIKRNRSKKKQSQKRNSKSEKLIKKFPELRKADPEIFPNNSEQQLEEEPWNQQQTHSRWNQPLNQKQTHANDDPVTKNKNKKSKKEEDKFWTFTTSVIFPKNKSPGLQDHPERDSLDGNLPGSSHGTSTGNPPPPPAPPGASSNHNGNSHDNSNHNNNSSNNDHKAGDEAENNPDGEPTGANYSKGPNAKNKKHKRLKNDNDTLDFPSKDKDHIKRPSYESSKTRDVESGGFRQKTEPYTYLWVVLSRMYGKLIILLMFAFCLTEVLENQIPPMKFQEVFLLYLYVGSILAIMCIYVTVIVDNCPSITGSKENLTKSGDDPEIGSITSFGTLKRAHISRSKTSRTSFYLRIGALVFGVGTLIYNGLEIAMHSSNPEGCLDDTVLAYPIMQALFTFLQMHFLFVNSEVIVEKFGQIARFGFMHLVATNLALWVRMVVWESSYDSVTPSDERAFGDTLGPLTIEFHSLEWQKRSNCYHNNTFGEVWKNSKQYLFPFIIQYSLIAASVTYIMWCNVGKERLRKLGSSSKSISDSTSTIDKRNKGRWKVDCRSSSKGLFLGLLVLVGGIIILIIFFVMKNQKDFHEKLLWMCNGTMMVIFSLNIIATIFGFIQIPKLSVSTNQPLDLDRLLLSVTVIGVYIFAIFGMIVGGIEYNNSQKLATFCSNTLLLVQVSLQGMLVAEASRRTCSNRFQMVSKPGRQVITFLLFSNITLWVLDTFMTYNSITHQFQIEFYGKVVWGVISKISLPLMILFRFHSAVILVEIWKNTYRTKTD